MNAHWLFRATIPGYAFLIPLLFYLHHIGINFGSHIIAASIAAGFPFGIFIGWIAHAILHCLGNARHPIIGPRIRETRRILNENDRINEDYLRGLINFIIHSDEPGLKFHYERWHFLASRTHSVFESIIGILLSNLLGIIILNRIIDEKMCLYQILNSTDLYYTLFVSMVVAFIFFWFYRICRNDLIAYESMLIRRYRREFISTYILGNFSENVEV